VITRELVEAGDLLGVPVSDHVIIGEGRYHSFQDERQLRSGVRRKALAAA
jgi:DNA repair protein RadC